MSTEVAKKTKDFFSQYPLKKYPKGQILVHAGDDPDAIHYLAKGKVQQYDISYRGDKVVVNIYKPKAFFPVSWAINRRPNNYFFECLTNVEVRPAPPDDVIKFLEENPDVTMDLLSRLYSGVDGLIRRMAHLMGGSAKSRLMYELLIECKRFGKPGPGGSYRVAVNETELAARSGMSRETVSRQMKDLKKQKLLEIKSGEIIVKDIKTLEKKLGADL